MSERKARIHPWVLIPLLLFVGLVGFHLVLVWRMHAVGAESVERFSWRKSAEFDALRASRDAFAEAGLQLAIEQAQGGIRCTIAGLDDDGGPVRAQLQLYRPSDAGLDRRVAWADAREAIAVPLPAAGSWTVDVELRRDERVLSARERIILGR